MELLNYTRRCKKKTGHERHKTLHAADNNKTFCEKDLTEMWFIESSAGLEPEDVTCCECRKVMRSNDKLTGTGPSELKFIAEADSRCPRGAHGYA